MTEKKPLPETLELAEQVGEFVYYWGFKRIHGRIWTHLYLADQPLDAADLVRQLSISKALVSISIRELLEFEVIQTAGKSPRGTQLYRTNPDIISVIMSVLRQREKRLLSHIQAAQGALGRVAGEERAASGISADQFGRLGDLIQKAVSTLDSVIAMKAVDIGEWAKVCAMPETSVSSNDNAEAIA